MSNFMSNFHPLEVVDRETSSISLHFKLFYLAVYGVIQNMICGTYRKSNNAGSKGFNNKDNCV